MKYAEETFVDKYILETVFPQLRRNRPSHVYQTVEMLHHHIEMMAAAYMRETKVLPDEAVLIHETRDGGRVHLYWFVKRDEVEDALLEERKLQC